MEKEKVGKFIATLRKEKKMTQKDLAEKLFLTDKAVSKWERGLSYPDISVLEPMSEILGVSILEILQGQRIEEETPFEVEEVQKMVDASILISDEEITKKHKRSKGIILLCCVLLMFVVSVALNIRNLSQNSREQQDILQTEANAYCTEEADGMKAFENPKAALNQMIEDYEKADMNPQLIEYLNYLKNSMEEER